MDSPTQPPRRASYAAGLLGLVVGLPLFALYAYQSRPSAGDYVPVQIVVSGVSIQPGTRGRDYVVIEGNGRRYQAENTFLRTTPYTAESLYSAVRVGAPATLWVEDPDAGTPRIRGLQSPGATISVEAGVTSDQGDRRALFFLAVMFTALGLGALWETRKKRRIQEQQA